MDLTTTANSLGIQQFNGSDYASWAFRMQLTLVEKDLWDTVINPKPEDVTAVWTKADRQAKCVIVRCLANNQLPLINNKETS